MEPKTKENTCEMCSDHILLCCCFDALSSFKGNHK